MFVMTKPVEQGRGSGLGEERDLVDSFPFVRFAVSNARSPASPSLQKPANVTNPTRMHERSSMS